MIPRFILKSSYLVKFIYILEFDICVYRAFTETFMYSFWM